MSTRKGTATRGQIVEAAWASVEDAGIEQLLGGVSLRDVARRAGVSPSVVTYHFGTMADLAEAMAQACMDELSMLPVEAVGEFLDSEGPTPAESIRGAVDANWEILASPEEQRYERRLMRLFAATGSPTHGEWVRSVVASGYWAPVIQHLETVYAASAERLGLRFIEPFTAVDLARVGAALNESLIQQWMIQGDDSLMRLNSDAVVALVSAITVPADRSGELSELELRLSGRVDSHHRAATIDAGEGAVDEMRRLAVASAGLFVDGLDPTFTEVAAATGRPVGEVASRFGSVRRIAAASFFRHVEGIEEAADRRAHRDPVLGVVDQLCELARAAQSDQHCAQALLHERSSAQMASMHLTGPTEIRALVPLGWPLFRALGQVVDLASDVTCDLAAILIDTTLLYALTRRDLAPATIADLATRLIPQN